MSDSNANFQLGELFSVKNKVIFPRNHVRGVNLLISALIDRSYHWWRLRNWPNGRTGPRCERSQSLPCWADRDEIEDRA